MYYLWITDLLRIGIEFTPEGQRNFFSDSKTLKNFNTKTLSKIMKCSIEIADGQHPEYSY